MMLAATTKPAKPIKINLSDLWWRRHFDELLAEHTGAITYLKWHCQFCRKSAEQCGYDLGINPWWLICCDLISSLMSHIFFSIEYICSCIQATFFIFLATAARAGIIPPNLLLFAVKSGRELLRCFRKSKQVEARPRSGPHISDA